MSTKTVFMIVDRDTRDPIYEGFHYTAESAQKTLDFFARPHLPGPLCAHCGKPQFEELRNPWANGEVVSVTVTPCP